LSKPQGLKYGIGLGFALFIMQGENGITFIPDALSNTNIEMASLVGDALHLHLSLFNEESVKDDESLFAK
jgi:hypothetical protein